MPICMEDGQGRLLDADATREGLAAFRKQVASDKPHFDVEAMGATRVAQEDRHSWMEEQYVQGRWTPRAGGEASGPRASVALGRP